MPKRFHLQRPDLAAAVTTALLDCKDVRSHQQLLAMRMAASGQFTAAQIAEPNGVSRRQFFHWVNALKAGGVAKLLERNHGWRATGPSARECPERVAGRFADRAVEAGPRRSNNGCPNGTKPNSP